MSSRLLGSRGPAWLNDSALMCFAVAGGAFAAAGLGFLLSFVLTGALSAIGMAAVGLLYLAMGILSLGRESKSAHGQPHVTLQATPFRHQEAPVSAASAAHRPHHAAAPARTAESEQPVFAELD